MEEVGTPSIYSDEKWTCVTHFEKTVRRDEAISFFVELPLRKKYEQVTGNL